MPVDICQPPAGKRSLTRTSGASSFDIFRSNRDINGSKLSEPPFATRVFHDSVVAKRNPFLEAARDIHDDVQNSSSHPRRSNRSSQLLRGESHIRFGECMTPEEADASLVRRPGSECKQRELTGHHIFYSPGQENDGGDGSGCCPKRPCSSSKTQELAGHNVFAFTDACYTLPPPPVVPYMPKERVIPPHNMPRNPRKFESHILGAPECVVAAPRPATCPSLCASSSYEIQNQEGNDVRARARLVEEAKTRAFQGNHIFQFNDEPRNQVEDEGHFSLSKLARRRDIRGNDIFGEGKLDNPWDQSSPAPCGKRHVGPCCTQSWAVDPQALPVNDPARYPAGSYNCKLIGTFGKAMYTILLTLLGLWISTLSFIIRLALDDCCKHQGRQRWCNC